MKIVGRSVLTIAAICACMLLTTFLAASQESKANTITAADVTAQGVYYDAVKANIQGDSKLADSLFTEFIKLKPDVAAAYYELSKLRIKQNNEEKATEYIKKAIKLDGENKWYKIQYADILATQNEFAKAAELYDEIAKKEPYNADYLYKAATYYKLSGKYKQALALLDKLLLQDGQDEDIFIQKQQIYLKINDLDNAVKCIEQLIEQNPKEPKYYAWLAEMYENNKEDKKAEEIFNKAQKAFPNDAAIQLGLAEHYKKAKDTVKYKEYVQRAITNKDLDPETQLSLLIPYLQELSNDSVRRNYSLELIRQLVAQHANDASTIAIYGEILGMNNQHDSALIQYKRAIAIDPSRFAVWQKLLSSLYPDKSDADSLVKYSEKAMRLFPNQAFVHYMNGLGQLNLQNYPAAIRAINRAIDIQPEDDRPLLADMYSTLGEIYNITKNFTLSDSCLNKALDLDPTNATVLNNYSYYLSLRGQKLDDAERMSKRSLELRPGEVSFLDTYGWILFRKGDYAKAKENIQKAIDTNPENADGTLYEHLGDVYFMLKETDKAIEFWKKAKEKGDNDPKLDKKIEERKLYE